MRANVLSQSGTEPAAGPPPLGVAGTLMLFGGAGLLLLGATHGVIPALATRTDVEHVVLWFAVAGVGVFSPLVLAIVVLLRQEGALRRPAVWQMRLRFRPMTPTDWLWSLGGLVTVWLLAAGGMTVLQLLWGKVRLHPSFMSMEPLTPNRYWILGAWLPFWVLNIMAEEILWRGVVLPRQEAAFGRWAWLVNGVAWLLFHLPFGPAILFMLGPTTLIVPYVVQRRKNS